MWQYSAPRAAFLKQITSFQLRDCRGYIGQRLPCEISENWQFGVIAGGRHSIE